MRGALAAGVLIISQRGWTQYSADATVEAEERLDARMQLAEWWAGGSALMLLLQGAEDVVTVPENAKRCAPLMPGIQAGTGAYWSQFIWIL